MHRSLFLTFLLLIQSNNNIGAVWAQNNQNDAVELQQKKLISTTTTDSDKSTLTSPNKKDIMTTTDKSKNSWPELVGLDGQEAKAKLEEQEPDKKIFLIPEGRMVTMDYRTDRIRIFLDGDGKVSRAPILG
mmetsp:Transcript_93180/g.268188  ORF Transcript_93180/g.268188 Transcript_93180/m.268188 type:complete len:131 (-) Transcript_93180:30-422(-)